MNNKTMSNEGRHAVYSTWRRWTAIAGATISGMLVVAIAGVTLWFLAFTKQVPFDHEAGSTLGSKAAEPSPLLRYDHTAIEIANRVVPSRIPRDHELRRITFPSVGDNGQPGNMVMGDYFRQPGKMNQRLVIILPIWGRDDVYPVRSITKGIASHLPDTNVLRLRGPNRFLDWQQLQKIDDETDFHAAFELYAERFRVNAIDIRRIIDWAEQQPEIDAQRIAVIGFSIGAVVGAMAVANEPRLHAGVLAMGGVKPAEILAHCDGRRGESRNAVMERFDWSLDDYRDAVQKHFSHIDALVRHPSVDPSRLLMIDALFDNCMPPRAKEALWERLDQPERIILRANHHLAFLSMTFLGLYVTNHRIYDFLDTHL